MIPCRVVMVVMPLKSFDEVRYDIQVNGVYESCTFWKLHGEDNDERYASSLRYEMDDRDGPTRCLEKRVCMVGERTMMLIESCLGKWFADSNIS